jgi:hypothetical protein
MAGWWWKFAEAPGLVPNKIPVTYGTVHTVVGDAR